METADCSDLLLDASSKDSNSTCERASRSRIPITSAESISGLSTDAMERAGFFHVIGKIFRRNTESVRGPLLSHSCGLTHQRNGPAGAEIPDCKVTDLI